MARPNKEDITESFHEYLDLAVGEDVFEILEENRKTTMEFFEGVPTDKHDYVYAEEKWPLKEVLCHLTSAEIYFCDLASRLTEGQSEQPLAPVLEKYPMKEHAHKSMEELLKDFDESRTSAIAFLKSFDTELFNKVQSINENHYTPHTIGYTIVGHAIHHCNVVRERYLG